jgi:hypothetical protein
MVNPVNAATLQAKAAFDVMKIWPRQLRMSVDVQ